MATLIASAARGFGGKQYIGRITGYDKRFRVEYVGKRGGPESGTTTLTYEPKSTLYGSGLFVVRDWTRNNTPEERYTMLLPMDGELHQFGVSSDEATRIARELQRGRLLTEVAVAFRGGWEFHTPARAEKAASARVVDAAVSECWEVLKGLPDGGAAKVVNTLKKMVSTPKESESVVK